MNTTKKYVICFRRKFEFTVYLNQTKVLIISVW